jgi:hypothetical protein
MLQFLLRLLTHLWLVTKLTAIIDCSSVPELPIIRTKVTSRFRVTHMCVRTLTGLFTSNLLISKEKTKSLSGKQDGWIVDSSIQSGPCSTTFRFPCVTTVIELMQEKTATVEGSGGLGTTTYTCKSRRDCEKYLIEAAATNAADTKMPQRRVRRRIASVRYSLLILDTAIPITVPCSHAFHQLPLIGN